MKQVNFQELYRKTYSALGFALKTRDQVAEKSIQVAEKRIGAQLPQSLRDYYLVAGKETVLNHAMNRLLPLADLEIENGKLVFMEENQCVVLWAANVTTRAAQDPKVFQGPVVDGEANKWYEEAPTCSGFLVFMLHLQAAYGGGMPHTGSATVPQQTVSILDAKWNFGGEVNGMRTYQHPGKAICFMKSRNFFTRAEEWRIIAGALDEESLDAIGTELGVALEK